MKSKDFHGIFFKYCAKMDNFACFKTIMILCTCWILLAIISIALTGKFINEVLPIDRYIGSVSTNSKEIILGLNSTGTERTDVLAVAYMRTGSTFLGKVLGWRNDVFFWFEPLRKYGAWQYLRQNDLLCHILRPNCEILSENSIRHPKKAQRFLLDMFDCHLQPYDNMPTDINFNPKLLPPSWTEYAKCKKSMNASFTCNKLLVNSCKTAKHRIAKVLRTDLEGTIPLLKNNPRLKIVHLLRDPRAIMNSHLRTWWVRKELKTYTQIEADSIVICSRMRSDILAGKSLMKLYPDRVRLLQYEDFNNLDENVQKLYKFLNMEFTSQQDNILRSLKKDSPRDKPTSKKNVTYIAYDGFHPFDFRQKMGWNISAIVQKYCGDVLRDLGLRQFKTEAEYLNLSQNVVIDKLPFQLT
ncbi:carbohydrate sulfotransferase 4-like [Mercenaria mercenaria]|uniref:carbohydrate sulfotransferase 4-like n=1 Tax=Mercenaria mercenaria TaxID=6596 RepID=UPI00234F6A68|nr:carbohydrate sulfotransferase 4-like [Mercenaria mercenaria]